GRQPRGRASIAHKMHPASIQSQKFAHMPCLPTAEADCDGATLHMLSHELLACQPIDGMENTALAVRGRIQIAAVVEIRRGKQFLHRAAAHAVRTSLAIFGNSPTRIPWSAEAGDRLP